MSKVLNFFRVMYSNIPKDNDFVNFVLTIMYLIFIMGCVIGFFYVLLFIIFKFTVIFVIFAIIICLLNFLKKEY